MRLCTVSGTVTATVKAERLTGLSLLVVESPETGRMVAADTVGAGVGDTVLVSEGSAARMATGLSAAPVDLAIVAIVDRVST